MFTYQNIVNFITFVLRLIFVELRFTYSLYVAFNFAIINIFVVLFVSAQHETFSFQKMKMSSVETF